MALDGPAVTTSFDVERDEAERTADALMRLCVREVEGDVFPAEPRDESTRTLATLWLAAEVRATRLERVCARVEVE